MWEIILMKNKNFSSIESIIKVAKRGGMYILVDDENRENEGDLVIPASNVSQKNINLVLKKVWHYSSESETHTVETHIHRLRKKILEKFNDNNFIKNNNKGYYIWKKNHEILLLEIFLHLNIEKESLNQKRAKEVLKEEKNNYYLI